MKRTLRIVALAVAVLSIGWWILAGANRGWTRNSVPVKTVDEITGIEAISYEKGFVPGVELLAGGLISAALLGGVSYAFKNKTNNK